MTLNITDAELHEWATMRADDAGRLARELVACRLQSQAAVAAAYEKAAQVCIERRQGWLAPYVRALATPDQIAALASPDTITLPRAEVEAMMEAARAFQMIRAVWTDPHNDNLMRKASMTLDALRERMK